MSRSRLLYIGALIMGWTGLWIGRQLPATHAQKELPRKPAAVIVAPIAIEPTAEAKESLAPIEVEKIR